jgi:hypothetical protein
MLKDDQVRILNLARSDERCFIQKNRFSYLMNISAL